MTQSNLPLVFVPTYIVVYKTALPIGKQFI